MISGISPANALNTQRINYYTKKPVNVQKQATLELGVAASYPSIYYVKKLSPSFRGFGCATDNFAPRNLYDIPCASCGKETLLMGQIGSFARSSRDKTGQDLIDALKSKNDYYKRTERKVVGQIIRHLDAHRGDGLLQSVQALNSQYIEQLEISQNQVLDKVKKVAEKNLTRKQAEKIGQFVAEAKESILNSDKTPFKRKDFLNKLEYYTLSFDKRFAQASKEVLDAARNLPNSTSSVPAFFAKYSRRSNDEIIRRLVLPSLATTEHIMPDSLGGPNRSDNFMVMCGDCNSKRQSMPYTEWLKIQPDMKDNFKKYIDAVTERIQIGELGERYSTYPAEVCETVKTQSKGEIIAQSEAHISRVKISEETIRPKKTTSFPQRLQAAEKSCSRTDTRLASLKDRQRTLQDDPEYKLAVEYYQFKAILEEMFLAKKDAQEELLGAKRSMGEHCERLEKKERYETDLKNPRLKDDERKRIIKRLRDLEISLESADISLLQAKINEIEQIIAGIDKRFANLRASQQERLDFINLPETLMGEIKELQKQEQTEEVSDKINTLNRRCIEIQEKIRAVRIDEEIKLAQKESDDADAVYQNLLACSPV